MTNSAFAAASPHVPFLRLDGPFTTKICLPTHSISTLLKLVCGAACNDVDIVVGPTPDTSLTTKHKFVARDEVPKLGLGHLIGTNLLRPYMHGFFVNHRLYDKARRLSRPFEYEEYRLGRVRERVEEKRTQRISVRKRVPRVNRALADRLSTASIKRARLLDDDRFAALFNDSRFRIT